MISYFRNLLVFKVWRSILKGQFKRRKQVLKLVALKIQTPTDFREKLSTNHELQRILPAIPKGCKDITDFLLKAKYSAKKLIKVKF